MEATYIIQKTEEDVWNLSGLFNTQQQSLTKSGKWQAYPWCCFNIKMDTLFTLLETDFILTQGNLS